MKRRAPGFVDRTRLAYIVIDVGRTPPALRDFAIEAYGLVKLGESDGHELHAPTVGTAPEVALALEHTPPGLIPKPSRYEGRAESTTNGR